MSEKKHDQDHIVIQPGLALTRREYFAAMALQGLLANPNFKPTIKISNPTTHAAYLALLAADSLLEQFKEYPQG